MKTLAVVGAQWGDEGKGKVVDVLAEDADMVARFGGGNNAGHTLVVDGRKIVTHLVPSGCTRPGTMCVLGAGMVIDPDVLRVEIDEIRAQGLLQRDELRVSLDAHIILPFHRELDGRREDVSPKASIGTTRRGIGPCYESKAARRGLRIRDLFDPARSAERLDAAMEYATPALAALGAPLPDRGDLLARIEGWAAWLEPISCDVSSMVDAAITGGQRVLFEGAQGALFDLDHGTYPFVTSSSTLAGGICTGLGIGPTRIARVWGISKAYVTRVGRGPFPTKLHGDEAHALREAGREYGATTGRPRDCGWLDLPALRVAARLNGLTGLCLTKLDVLLGLPGVKLCTSYCDGLDPGRDGFENARPVLEEVPGWGDPGQLPKLANAQALEDLPRAIRAYLDRITDHIGVPITLLSSGPERHQTLRLADPF